MKVYMLLEWYPKEFLQEVYKDGELSNTYSVVGLFSKKKFAKDAKKKVNKDQTVQGSYCTIEKVAIDEFATHSNSFSYNNSLGCIITG